MARPAAKPAPIALVRTGHMTPRTTTHPGPQKEDYKAGSGGHKRLALPLTLSQTPRGRQIKSYQSLGLRPRAGGAMRRRQSDYLNDGQFRRALSLEHIREVLLHCIKASSGVAPKATAG